MDKNLLQLKSMLEETISKVEKLASENDHDTFIELMEQVADERDEMLGKLDSSVAENPDHRPIINEILELDQQLNRMTDQYFESFKREIIMVKKKKTSNVKYTNPYKNLKSPDGAFLDKKK